MKRLRRLTSVLLSLSMLTGYVQVRAEGNTEPEEPETEVIVTEEPAEETEAPAITEDPAGEPVIEAAPEESSAPEEETAAPEETAVPEETEAPEVPAEPEQPAEEPEEEAVPQDTGTGDVLDLPEELYLPAEYPFYLLPTNTSEAVFWDEIEYGIYGSGDLDAEITDNGYIRFETGTEEGSATFWVTYTKDGQDYEDEMTVYVEKWVEGDTGYHRTEARDKLDLRFRLAGKAENSKFELDVEEGTFYTAKKGITAEDGFTQVQLTINGTGDAILSFVVDDPNGYSGTPFFLSVCEVLAINHSPLESISFPHTEMNIKAGDEELRYVFVEPDGFDPDLITAVSSDEDVVTVEAVEGQPYRYRITGVSAGSAEITFSAEGKEAKCTVNVEALYFNVPEKMYLPVQTDVEIPVDTNLSEYHATMTIEKDEDSSVIIPFSSDGHEISVLDTYENGVPATITVYKDDPYNPLFENIKTTIYSDYWLEYDLDPLTFAGTGSKKAKNLTVTLTGPLAEQSDKTVKLLPDPDETGAPVWSSSLVSGNGTNTQTFKITPLAIGQSAMYAQVPDPNQNGKTIFVPLNKDVLVYTDDPITSIEVAKSNTGDPLTSIAMEPEKQTSVVVRTVPEMADPSSLSVTSSDPSLVSVQPMGVEKGFIIRSGSKQGTATLTFKGGKAETQLEVKVIKKAYFDTDTLKVPYTGNPDADRRTINLTLKGIAKDQDLLYDLFRDENGQDLHGDEIPFEVSRQLIRSTDEEDVWQYTITPTKNKSAELLVNWSVGTAAMGFAGVWIDISEPHITIPEELTYNDGTWAPWPIETNMTGLEIRGSIPDRQYNFTVDSEQLKQEPFHFELYPEDGDEVSLPVNFTAVDKATKQVVEEFSTTLHIGRWLDYNGDAMVFKGENASPQEFRLTASGPYEGKEIMITSPDSEIGHPAWTGEQTGAEGNTRIFRITPKHVGFSTIAVMLPDLNKEGSYVSAPLCPVYVTETTAGTDLALYRAGWAHDESARLDSMILDWGMEKGVTVVTTPEFSDPSRLKATSSKPALVSVTKDPTNPYTYKLKAADNASGSAVISFTNGTKTVKLPVTVHRLIEPARDYVPMFLAEDSEPEPITIPITVREPASSVELNVEVEADFLVPFESEDEAPVSIQLNRISDTQYECVITPLQKGGAVIRFYTNGTEPYGDEFAQTAIWAEVREQEQLEWYEEMVAHLEDEKRNNSEFTLNLKQDNAVIKYALQYYDDEETARAAIGTEVPADEWKTYSGRPVRIESGSTKVHSYGRIVAKAHKDGWIDAEPIDKVFTIVFDGHIDGMLARYMKDNDLDLNDIKDELTVLRFEDNEVVAGAPEHVTYTGSTITFNNDLNVFYGIRRLSENVDYKIAYANNTAVAAADSKKAPTVKITGIGQYTKTWSQKFAIEKYSLLGMVKEGGRGRMNLAFADTDWNRIVTTTSSAKKAPVMTLTPYLLDRDTEKKVTLKKGTDYEVWYYPITRADGQWQPDIDYNNPTKTLSEDTHEYIYAVFALPGSKKISGTKAEFEANPSLLENYLAERYVPDFEVVNTTDNPVIDLSKAKLSKNIGTLNLELKYDEVNDRYYYDENDVIGLFTGDAPAIKLTSGSRRLIVSGEDEADPEADVSAYFSGPIEAGSNYLRLRASNNTKEGMAPVKGTRLIKFTVKPIVAVSSKTVKVNGLVKALKLDDYNRVALIKDGELDLSKLTDPESDGIKLVVKKSGQVIDPACYYDKPVVTSRITGGTGSITLTFKADPHRGYTGSISVKIPIQIPTLAELKTAGKIRAEFGDPTVPQTAQYSQLGATPRVRLIYTNYDGSAEFDLMEGLDYKVTYTNNKVLSTPTKKAYVTITGMGWFKGTLKNELSFDVVPAVMNEPWANRMDVKSADITYNAKGKAGYFRSAPKVYDGTKVLKSGKDYKVLDTIYYYAENVRDENGKVIHVIGEEVHLTDNPQPGTWLGVDQRIQLLNPRYTSNIPDEEENVIWIHSDYRMITKAMNIASAKVTVNGGKAVYLGNNWAITPEIQVVLNKVVLNPEDYEIVSIDKNWLPGTATMIIQGRGNYAGTKKVTFKITKTPFVK